MLRAFQQPLTEPSRLRRAKPGRAARVIGIACVILTVLLTISPAVTAASRFDPRLRFRTLTTPHFHIYFHQGEEALAARLAAIAEELWPRVGDALGVQAPRRTHIVLGDQSDYANGWATPFPYNTIFVTAAAPSGSDFVGKTDDWLRLVFAHEFTHIVQLDRSEGFMRFLRGAFGRTPVAFPNMWLPGWAIEGLAVWEESALTGSGRREAGDFRAIEQEAGRAQRTEPLDRTNGSLTDWPGGSTPYSFGLGFHQFLAGRHGEQTFAALYDATAGRVPFFGTGAFASIYGESLGQLWDEYRRSLEALPAAGSRSAPRRLTHHGFTVVGPRFVPPPCADCPPEILYSVRNPHGLPALRATELDGANDRQLTTRYLGSTLTATPKFVVFDEQEVRRNVGIYSDLYLLDLRSGHKRALSREQRLRDPDLSPNGQRLVAVRESRGQRDLVVLPFDGSVLGEAATLLSAPETRFDTPRWSPDGRTIVVVRQSTGTFSELVLVEVENGRTTVLATSPATRFNTPAWRPDGGAVVAAADFDNGPFDLYEFPIDGASPRRLTETTGGASWPDVSPDGRTLVYVGYTGEGFDLFTVPYEPREVIGRRQLLGGVQPTDAQVGASPSRISAPSSTSSLAPASLLSLGLTPMASLAAGTTYRPWSTLLPTSWTPVIETGDGVRAGFNITGNDVLARHVYSATATWLLDAPAGAWTPAPARPDWRLSYAYDRWRPVLFASAGSSTRFFSGVLTAGAALRTFNVDELEMEAGVLYPVRHVRSSERLVASVVGLTDRYREPGDVPTRQRTAVRLGASASTALTFGYSISPERGVVAGVTTELARRGLGSDAEATIATADVRAYLPGARPHHVVALRAAGGLVNQAVGSRDSFRIGGAAASLDVLDFGRDALAPLRGFPRSNVGGTRVASVSADYRFPLARPQRGIGTWPVFLQTVHGAAFADVANTWVPGTSIPDPKFSLGGELSWDLVVGYSYGFTATLGAAWGRDQTDPRERAAVFVRIGRAF